ncbi:MAG: hypothetical protein IPH06_04550 [Alphaproteobacteria bacterium]|nr:hypothetical protein [Alphaproteobacteria bacterium]QQS57298.1 MAG: hypothetical protein IPN28_00310 [Alphaproteobacteria bacterium]
MDQNDGVPPQARWLWVAGGYCAFLCLGILGGILFSGEGEYDVGNAVEMPEASVVIALVLGVAAAGLFWRKTIGRLAFFIAAPWGALALAASWPFSLWQEDIPYTVLLAPVYALLVFFISRGGVLATLGAADAGWVRRGGAALAVCVVIMGAVRLFVATSPPSGGGGLFGLGAGMNEYVQRMVMCDVPLWHYAAGLLAVSIPTRFRGAVDGGEGGTL